MWMSRTICPMVSHTIFAAKKVGTDSKILRKLAEKSEIRMMNLSVLISEMKRPS